MGTLYHGLSLRMLKRLDRYEGNQYRRVLVSVYCHDGRWREAFVYRLKDPGQLSEQAWRPVGGTVRGGDE